MPPAIDLACCFADALAALRAVHDFDDWIGQYWQEQCPAPETAAASRTALGAEGAIVWHEGDHTVFGYLPGHGGCFCVPRDVAMPSFPFSAGSAPIPYGQDIVVRAAMQEELQSPGS